ncbi:MAG: RidA family protein [Chitinophagales bacterium]|nr:RidA family protein [Chitinophagales bacterium]
MSKTHFKDGVIWEDEIGYARAVKMGNIIEISGTTATVNGNVVGENNVYEQTKCIIEKAIKVLEHFNASVDDVIRTRIFCADISQWQEIGKAHSLFFKDSKPATGMYQMAKLIDEKLLVEIEFTAIVE